MTTNPVNDWSILDAGQRRRLLERPSADRAGLESTVRGIIEDVRNNGDAAVRRFALKFDGFTPRQAEVPAKDWATASSRLDTPLAQAMDRAAARIEQFHDAARPTPVQVETAPDLRCETRYLPIEPVGLYVPGGSAPLISTVLMLALPARLAGCREVVLCTPPGADGRVHPAVMAAAHRCGVTRLFAIGGAQAIAAMAFGTESVPACAKLFGPGNAWVTEAKRQVSGLPGGPAQDLPAGPSEVLVIADGQADATAVAWDLLSQAEHGPDSQAVLVSDDRGLLQTVSERIAHLAAQLPRADILASALDNLRLIKTADLESAVNVSNAYAPEHLILNCLDAESLLEGVTAAGSVFVGPWTPESLGDYASGTNHVLPTYGYARAYSGLGVSDFQRRMTVQTAGPDGLRAAGADAIQLAAAEGLDAHRMAVQWRLDQLENAS